MSGKLVYSLTDEKTDLHKQIGCMNGVFQLFNRNHLLGSRRMGGHDRKRLPTGKSDNPGMEAKSATQKATEKNPKEVGRENQRVSVESSRPSFSSSSCSSTFSSVDCNKTAQPELSSFCQSIPPQTPSRVLPVKQPNSSLHLGREFLDLRDVVKDSMYREARVLLVKTMGKQEAMGHALKHIDSPRPLQQFRTVQPRVTGLEESTRGLAMFQNAQRNSKDTSLMFTPKEAPRFSYDGRESRDALTSTVKLKELPRLSLDSRQGSMRISDSESRSNYILKDLHSGNGISIQDLDLHQEPGSNKRPSSVVAKLMGLEAFPDSISTNEGQTMNIRPCLNDDFDPVSRSSKTSDEHEKNQVSRSPNIVQKDPAYSRMRNVNSVMKPTSSSRFPLEPAPWRQPAGTRSSQKEAFREAPTKAPLASPSVYGEIEKRLTKLEFKNSGKDLRALKQTLEAMQKTRESLENNTDEQASKFESQTNKYNPDYSRFNQGPGLAMQQSQQIHHPVSPTIKGTSPSKGFESPIVIIKPSKVMEKTRITGSSRNPNDNPSSLRKLKTGDSAESRKDFVEKRTTKDPSPRNNHFRDPSSWPVPSTEKKTSTKTLRSMQASKAPQHMTEENHTSFGRSSGNVSPRLQQKKHGTEKQSRPTTPSSDVSRSRRQSNKQKPIEPSSPGKKLKPKSNKQQQGYDQSGETSSETRNLSHQSDTISMQSESNISWASQIDTEVTITNYSDETNGTCCLKDPKEKNPAKRLSEDRSMAELAISTLEQPSPVSVLDATFYREEPPSPVKKISNAFEDDETLNSGEEEWHPEDLHQILNSTRPNLSSEFNHKKLENIKHLIYKLRLLNSSPDEADHITSLCQSTNPDHRYITEILLASGLLKELNSPLTAAIELHPSGQLINPRWFHILEQTKGSTALENEGHNDKIAQSKFNEKIHGKLVFDTVNEILVQKLAWKDFSKLGWRIQSGKKLLKELCSEIDLLQANSSCSLEEEDDGLISIISADMMHQSNNWADYCCEVPGLVLDIERLIFKDLISEVVNGEAAGLQDRPRRHCRQLFSK